MNTPYDRTAWLKGRGATCRISPPLPDRAYRLILLGPPGVGKGTQAELLGAAVGACHLSTGDVFRAAKCLPDDVRSPALKTALQSMAAGALVSDEMVLRMVRERKKCLHCHSGFLLDGFPRTVPQAEALEKLLQDDQLPLTAVLNYELEIEKIVARLAGRRTCPKCKSVYHVTNRPPATPGICDECASPLIQREDDQPEAIRVRMRAYAESTTPLIDFYRERGLLLSVPADGSAEETCGRTLNLLHARVNW